MLILLKWPAFTWVAYLIFSRFLVVNFLIKKKKNSRELNANGFFIIGEKWPGLLHFEMST